MRCAECRQTANVSPKKRVMEVSCLHAMVIRILSSTGLHPSVPTACPSGFHASATPSNHSASQLNSFRFSPPRNAPTIIITTSTTIPPHNTRFPRPCHLPALSAYNSSVVCPKTSPCPQSPPPTRQSTTVLSTYLRTRSRPCRHSVTIR